MKALVGAFNQEKASVIVKTGCETDGSFYSTSRDRALFTGGSHMTLATINTMLWDGILNMQTNSELLRSGQYTLDTCVVTPLFAHVWPRTAAAGATTTPPSVSSSV